MVLEEVIVTSADVLARLGSLGKWIQAIGLFVILWLIFQGIALRYTLKRIKHIVEIKRDMKRIESKIDSLLKKKR